MALYYRDIIDFLKASGFDFEYNVLNLLSCPELQSSVVLRDYQNQALETIQGELIGVMKHSDALKIFERYGIKAYSQALSMLGYRVKWSGLDPDNAEILRI